MSEFTDTDIPWVGDIPQDWGMFPLFSIARENKKKNKEKNENVLSLSYGKIIRRDLSKNFGLLPENFDGYQVVDDGYIIIRSTDLQNDKKSLRVGLVNEYGVITSAYIGLSPSDNIYPNYLFYYLNMCDLKKVFYSLGGGLRQSLRFEEFRRFPIVVPPLEEQKLISRYLDKKTKQIDRLVEKIQKKIELIKEQQTSFINQCVTKGLDPNVELKDSGVEWIGMIPKNFSLVKLRWVIDSIKDGTHGTHPSSDDGKILLSGKNVHDGFLKITNNERFIPLEEHEKITKNGYPKQGDVLVSCVGSIGRSCVFDNPEPISFQRSVCFIRPSEKLNSYYLSYLIRSHICQNQINTLINQSTVGGIYMGDLTNLLVLIPPIEDQFKIVSSLDKKNKSINSLIVKIEKKKDLLKEYRRSLISSVVTGKVRITEDMI